MPTDTIPTTTPRLASCTRVDVLDFGPMRDEAVAHYISLDPSRGEWPEEKKKRLVIATTCAWGRVTLENDRVYMLSESGEGPRKPLGYEDPSNPRGERVTCQVSLLASMQKGHGEAGWLETKPFAKVEIDDVNARKLPTIGGVQLEEFIRVRAQEFESTYNAWRTLLINARNKIEASRAKNKAAATVTPEVITPAQGTGSLTPDAKEEAPPVAEGAPPIRGRKPPGGRISM